jgi:hypothetical protein
LMHLPDPRAAGRAGFVLGQDHRRPSRPKQAPAHPSGCSHPPHPYRGRCDQRSPERVR